MRRHLPPDSAVAAADQDRQHAGLRRQLGKGAVPARMAEIGDGGHAHALIHCCFDGGVKGELHCRNAVPTTPIDS